MELGREGPEFALFLVARTAAATVDHLGSQVAWRLGRGADWGVV